MVLAENPSKKIRMTSNMIILNTEIGRIGIAESDGLLTRIYLPSELPEKDCNLHQDTPALVRAARQLMDYLAGDRKEFDLPLAPEGTCFMRGVWAVLCTIPYGEVRTYSEVARAVGSPHAARAVGLANHRNPIPIIIPCHRIIGTDGKLVGYRGGLELKSYLLRHEQAHVHGK